MCEELGLNHMEEIEGFRTWDVYMGVPAGIGGTIVKFRAQNYSYGSQEFFRYLSLQQSTLEPSILVLHCSALVPYLFGIIL